MVKLNSALVALNKRIHVKYLNSNRKPRHVDNGMVGLFSLSMERDKGVKARWVDAGLVDAHLRSEYYSGSTFLSQYFKRSFSRALPDLEENGYIRFNHDRTKFRVSKRSMRMFRDAASAVLLPVEEVQGKNLVLPQEIILHRMRCDYFRFKMSPVRLPYNMIMEDNLELRDANSKLQERLSTLQPQAYPRRESSVDTLASDGILETDAPDVDDVDMEENFSFFDSEPVLTEAPSSGLPIAGPSSIVTPARDNFQNPAGYYPTPESPQRANGARSLPLSPSLGRASFSSMTVPPSDLELDEDLATGPPILLPKYVEKASLTDNSELEQTIMNLQDELARVNATIEQERKDLDDQHSKDIAGLRRELEERIRDLEDERAVYQELLELSEAENARIENEHCQQLVGSMGVFGMDVASIVNKRQEELALAREAKKQERRELGRKMVEERRQARLTGSGNDLQL